MGAAFHIFASAGLVSSDLFDAPYFARYASEFPVIFGDKIRAAFQLMYSGTQKLVPEARAGIAINAMSPFCSCDGRCMNAGCLM